MSGISSKCVEYVGLGWTVGRHGVNTAEVNVVINRVTNGTLSQNLERPS